MKKKLFLISFMLCSNAFADCVNNICDGVTVEEVYQSSTFYKFGTSGDEQNLNCTPDAGNYILLDMTQAYAEVTASVLLAAHQGQSEFWVNTHADASGICYVTSIQSKK